jgi:hypothetical protein
VTTCDILDLQVYHDNELGDIFFVDQKQHHHATKAKARDITIMSPQVSDEDQKRLAADIAVDIAINQGHNAVGIRRDI